MILRPISRPLVSLPTRRRGGTFAPGLLFQNGEQGGWWDPSDFSTMYQDSAGTTPVTAVGQPVGMIRDKSGRGNHRTQATAASRPTLSARYNAIVSSEDLSTASWTRTDVTPTTGAVPPSSVATASTLLTEGAAGTASTINSAATTNSLSAVGRISLKRGNTDWVRVRLLGNAGADGGNFWVNLATGAAGSSSAVGAGTGLSFTVTAQADGWYAVAPRATAAAGATWILAIMSAAADASTARVNGATYNVTAADIRSSADAALSIPAYQRVTTSTDYDVTGFPLYLSFDGVDDSLATASVDFSATDKMTVWAGVHKASDAAAGIFVEAGADVGSVSGTFFLAAKTDSTFEVARKASGVAAYTATAAFTAPTSRVFSFGLDLAAAIEVTAQRVDGAASGAVGAADTGTGNFTAQPIYFGRRGGSTLPFNGREYCTIIRGAATSDSQIARVERFVAARMGVALA